MRRIIINSLICISFLSFNSCKHKYVRDYSPQNNFETLWSIIDKKYCFLTEKNIDWQSVKEIYQPKIKKVKTQLEMFDVFSQMLDTLQDGHVNLYSAFDISRCRGWFENYPKNFSESLIFSPRYLGKDYRIGSGFLYKRIANGDVGYIRYESFSDNISTTSLLYIQEMFKYCKGIIIDVRNNGGGSLSNSELLASVLMSENRLTGYIRHKTGVGHNDFSEPRPIYTNKNSSVNWSGKKIVVLVNRRCYSATNDFVCRVKNANNVTTIGGITGGGGGIPISNELPNGWMVRFSAVQMLDTEQKQIEFGIKPDIEEQLLDSDISKGFDTIIERAIKEILQ